MSAPDHAPRFTSLASRRALEIVAVTLVLLLAAYLRLNHLEWTEFKQDEAHLSQIAYDMARTGVIPLRSIGASTGVVNLPLAAWLLAIPYAVSGSPIVATAFLAGLNVLAVALCYAMARSWFKSWSSAYVLGALAAALLFAVAPWAIVYSRKLWANDFLPLFVAGWAWTGWLAWVRKKPWWLIAHAALLGACIQLHYSALMLAPVSAVWFMAFIKRVSWRAVLIAAAVLALLFAPFLLADAGRGWPNMTRFMALFQQPATSDTAAISNAWLLSTGLEIHSLAGPQEFENFRVLVPWADGVSWLVGLLVIAGLIIAVIDVLRAIPRRQWHDRSAVAFLLATWLLIPIIGQLSHRTPLYVHYFLPVLPAPFVVAGYLVARVALTPAHSLRGRGSAVLAALIALIALAQAYQTIMLQQFVASRPTPGAMGIPIGYYERLVNLAKDALKQSGGTGVIVNTNGSNPNSDEYPAIFHFLLNEVAHRFVDVGRSARVYPLASHIQIDYVPDQTVRLAEAGRESIGEVALRGGERPGRVYRSGGYANPPCDVTAPPGRWQNGVSLLSSQIDPVESGAHFVIHLCLKIDQPAAEEFHWTAQLWDKTGRRWAQVDDAGYPAHYWRPGDVITQDMVLDIPADLPAGDYVLRVGQYMWPDVKPVLALDVAGNPYSDAVEIPVRVPE
jgi:4-amino-4-deoxy-L-arabinose transferase-like glycosyltransferase